MSFAKMMRGQKLRYVLSNHPNAMLLAILIAERANWTTERNAEGCAPGEAMIGDHQACGLTRQQYRTALEFLSGKGNHQSNHQNNQQDAPFVTTRTTNRGTFASFTDSRLFEICIEPGNHQNNQQSSPRATTKKTQKQPLTRSIVELNRDSLSHSAGAVIEGSEFPKTEADALATADAIGCEREFAALVWNKANACGALDGKSRPIRNWKSYLSTEWGYERKRRQDKIDRRNRVPIVDRNRGTCNEGHASDYANIG